MAEGAIQTRLRDFNVKEQEERRRLADFTAAMQDEVQVLVTQATQRVYQLRTRAVVSNNQEGGRRKKPAKAQDVIPSGKLEGIEQGQEARREEPSMVPTASNPSEQPQRNEAAQQENQEQQEAGPSEPQASAIGQKRGRQTTRAGAASKRAKAKPAKPADEAPASPTGAPAVDASGAAEAEAAKAANALRATGAPGGSIAATTQASDLDNPAVAPKEHAAAAADASNSRSGRQNQKRQNAPAPDTDGGVGASPAAAGTSAPAAPAVPAFSPRVTRSRRGPVTAQGQPPPPPPKPRGKSAKQKRDLKEAQLGSPGLHPKTKLATDANVSVRLASPAGGEAGQEVGVAVPNVNPGPDPSAPGGSGSGTGAKRLPVLLPLSRSSPIPFVSQPQQEQQQHIDCLEQQQQLTEQPKRQHEQQQQQGQQQEREEQQQEVREEQLQKERDNMQRQECEEQQRRQHEQQEGQQMQRQEQQAIAKARLGRLPSAVKATVALFEGAKSTARCLPPGGSGTASAAVQPKAAAIGAPSTSRLPGAHETRGATASVAVANNPTRETAAESRRSNEGGFCFGTQQKEHSSPEIPHFRQAAEHGNAVRDDATDVSRAEAVAPMASPASANDDAGTHQPDEAGSLAMEEQPTEPVVGLPMPSDSLVDDNAVVEDEGNEGAEQEAGATGAGEADEADFVRPEQRNRSLSLAPRSPSAVGLACTPVQQDQPREDSRTAAEASNGVATEEAGGAEEEAMQELPDGHANAAPEAGGDLPSPVLRFDDDCGEYQQPVSAAQKLPDGHANAAPEAGGDLPGPVLRFDDECVGYQQPADKPLPSKVLGSDVGGAADLQEAETSGVDPIGYNAATVGSEEDTQQDAAAGLRCMGDGNAEIAAAEDVAASKACMPAASPLKSAASSLKLDAAAPRPLEAQQPSKPKAGNLVSCVRSFLPTRTAPSPPPAAGRAAVEVKALKAAQAAKQKEAARAAERAQARAAAAERHRPGQPDATARPAPAAIQGAITARPTPAPSATLQDVDAAPASVCTAVTGAVAAKSTAAMDEPCNGATATSNAAMVPMSVKDKAAFFQAREELAKRTAAELGAGRRPGAPGPTTSQGAAPSYKAGATVRAALAEDATAATSAAPAPSVSTTTSAVPAASPRPAGRPPAGAAETAADKHKRVEARRREEEDRRRAELEARTKAKDDKMRNFEATKQQRLAGGNGAGTSRPPAPPAANPLAAHPAGKRPPPNNAGAGPFGGVSIKPEPESNRTGPTAARTPGPKIGPGPVKTPAPKAGPAASVMVSPAVQMQVKLLPAVHAGAGALQPKPQLPKLAGAAGPHTSVGVNLPGAANGAAQAAKQAAAGAAAGGSQHAAGLENATPGAADLTEQERRNVHAIQTSPYIGQVKSRTPGVTTATKPQFNSYEISPYRSDSDASDDDSPRRRKPLPEWAAPHRVLEALQAQRALDADAIFGKCPMTIDIVKVFSDMPSPGKVDARGRPRRNYNNRGSSGQWDINLA